MSGSTAARVTAPAPGAELVLHVALRKLYGARGLSTGEIAIATALLLRANRLTFATDKYGAPLTWIARQAGFKDLKAPRRNIRRLEARGFVTKAPQYDKDGKQIENLYTLDAVRFGAAPVLVRGKGSQREPGVSDEEIAARKREAKALMAAIETAAQRAADTQAIKDAKGGDVAGLMLRIGAGGAPAPSAPPRRRP